MWDQHKEQKLRELWTKGLSASKISEQIPGTTRNSIIGKSNRLGLESRALRKKTSVKGNIENNVKSEIKIQKFSKKARFRALLVDKNFPPESPIFDVSKLTDDHCRYPSNHPGDKNFYFCGRKPFDGQVYCRLHLMLCFTPKNPKEKDQITEDDIPKFIEKKIKSA